MAFNRFPLRDLTASVNNLFLACTCIAKGCNSTSKSTSLSSPLSNCSQYFRVRSVSLTRPADVDRDRDLQKMMEFYLLFFKDYYSNLPRTRRITS